MKSMITVHEGSCEEVTYVHGYLVMQKLEHRGRGSVSHFEKHQSGRTVVSCLLRSFRLTEIYL